MKEIIVIGGGAAGFFAAITAARLTNQIHVTLLERNRALLSKVRISGGGRCNVTHACFDPKQLVTRYPRGKRALLGPLNRFGPVEAIEWFREAGVELKTESDGRMFPVTDRSETIIDLFLTEAHKAGVIIRTECDVSSVRRLDVGFELTLGSGELLYADKLLFASGSHPKSYELIRSLGHTIVPPVPSLFTFTITDPRLEGLSGLSVSQVELSLPKLSLEESGPLLITHWGLSGPAVLKLSAFGARLLHAVDYKTELQINWIPAFSSDQIRAILASQPPKKMIHTETQFGLPKNLWRRLLLAAQIPENCLFAHFSTAARERLIVELTRGSFQIQGKATNKDEFVTAGGVSLDEVQFQTMESKICPGLYFAGEVLDIDGITGGYNFQNAWTTGWLAGHALASQKT